VIELFQQRILKRIAGQVGGETFSQAWQLPLVVIVTDGLPGRFPDMLLRVQLRRCRWKGENLQTWIGLQDSTDLWLNYLICL